MLFEDRKKLEFSIIKPDNIENILIIGSIGIGNLLLFSGALRAIRKHFSNANISIIVLKEAFKCLYENDPDIDEIIVLDAEWTKSIYQMTRFIKQLRRTNYQLCITTFPANRFEYNVLAFLSGADRRIAHKYGLRRLKSFSFLQNIRIPMDKTLHDFEQNLNLLIPLGIDPGNYERKINLTLPESAEHDVSDYFDQLQLKNKILVGMHPGSSVERGMIYKRWPAVNFSQLCDWLFDRYGAQTLLFGGPEEEPLQEDIAVLSKSNPVIVKGLNLLASAALIKKCGLFITNDSGLMHVAAAVGTKTVALFGPSDPLRTSPVGEGHEVIRLGMECSPCWNINNVGVGKVNCVYSENRCMTELRLDSVKKVLEKYLNGIHNE